MENFFGIDDARDYKNIDVYKKLMSENDGAYVYDLLIRAVKTMSAKEFLEFTKELKPVIKEKRIWANLLIEVKNGKLPEDKEQSGIGKSTSNYHKNLARVAFLSEGADFSEWDKSQGFDPNLEYDINKIKSWGRTPVTRHLAEKYRSGVVNMDKKIERKTILERLAQEKQNS